MTTFCLCGDLVSKYHCHFIHLEFSISKVFSILLFLKLSRELFFLNYASDHVDKKKYIKLLYSIIAFFKILCRLMLLQHTTYSQPVGELLALVISCFLFFSCFFFPCKGKRSSDLFLPRKIFHLSHFSKTTNTNKIIFCKK